MVHIRLDVRPIPQLYGSSYKTETLHADLTSIDFSNKLLGSCLSASLEMLIDHMKRSNRVGAYSSFRNAGQLNGAMTRIGHPNGDKTVNLMWNQATLHCTIYGHATRLIELVGEDTGSGGFGMATTSVSLSHSLPNPHNTELAIPISTNDDYLVEIERSLNDGIPMIASVEHLSIEKSQNEFPSHRNFENISELPISYLHEKPTVKHGHAVVIAGMVKKNLGTINDPMGDFDLLILDPSPSIELENFPSRFYNPVPHLSNPDFHTHRVNARDFVQFMRPTRGIISIHPR